MSGPTASTSSGGSAPASSASSTGIYDGSCHCGACQYKVRLTFPPNTIDPRADSIRIYKCNCSTCHKMGLFHLRPRAPAEDFILLTPSPDELGDYRCFKKQHGWYFCKVCGVRVFGVGAKWVETTADATEWSGVDSKGRPKDSYVDAEQKAWTTKPMKYTEEVDGKTVEKEKHYLSINATTLEDGQDGVDLIAWHENGWIAYVDARDRVGGTRLGKPHRGGMY